MYIAAISGHTAPLLPRPRWGLRGIVFTLSVCLYVCLCVCVSGQYFGILYLGY